MAPELVLQPGSVVNAQVLKVLSADLVRIAIASLSIDVASEIPLQQGQTLQLAVIADQGRHPPRHGRAGRRRRRCIGRRRDAVAGCAGRCGRQSADHRVAEERADAAGARGRLGRGAGRGHRTGQPGAAVCQSRRCGFRQHLPPKLQRRSRRCWRNRPASIKISTAATSRRRSRNPACSSRRRWRRAQSPPAAFPTSRPR